MITITEEVREAAKVIGAAGVTLSRLGATTGSRDTQWLGAACKSIGSGVALAICEADQGQGVAAENELLRGAPGEHTATAVDVLGALLAAEVELAGIQAEQLWETLCELEVWLQELAFEEVPAAA
ncbi:MAG: hypothetical protein AAGI11_17630 [Pseudomonadota bacterium]